MPILTNVVTLIALGWYGTYLYSTKNSYPDFEKLQHGIYTISSIHHVSGGFWIFEKEYKEFCFDEDRVCFRYSLRFPFFHNIYKVGNELEIWIDGEKPQNIRQVHHEKKVVLSYKMAKWYITRADKFFLVIYYILFCLWIIVVVQNVWKLLQTVFFEKGDIHKNL